MEKLICNKNLALSAKAPPFEQSVQRVLGDGTGGRGPDIHNSRHFLFLFLTGGGQRTARIASSNTVLRPRCVSAEHSRYLTAPVGNTASPSGQNGGAPRPDMAPRALLCGVPKGKPDPESTSPGGTAASITKIKTWAKQT